MNKFFSRLLDVFLSGITLLFLLPFLLPIVILLRLTGEGEILYLQDRVGYKNSTFKIWKFATMLKNSPNMGTGSLTVKNDSRVTPIGKFLRKTKLNELPQIVNVLKGDMSIVGPRPQMKVDFDVYPPNVKKHIYDLRPGITSVGSIVFRDEESIMSKSTLSVKEFYAQEIAPYKGELELWYQNRASLFNDLKVIFITAWTIFFPKSDLVYKMFSDFPEKPDSLKL